LVAQLGKRRGRPENDALAAKVQEIYGHRYFGAAYSGEKLEAIKAELCAKFDISRAQLHKLLRKNLPYEEDDRIP
jgi:hypothetical protein